MSQKPFRKILTDWIEKMRDETRQFLGDGTPNFGMFETEELYRQGQKFLNTPEPEPKFGDMTNAQRERLEMLIEEAAEIIQVGTKILRHGYQSHHPNSSVTNRLDLEKELIQFWTVYERMAHHGEIGRLDFYDSPKIWAKKMKYTHHQPAFSHPSNPDRSNKAILTTEPMQFWTVYERMAYHGEINRIIVKITEIAWDLYCRETKGAMSSVNTWAELGVNTRKEYLVKAAGKLGLSK